MSFKCVCGCAKADHDLGKYDCEREGCECAKFEWEGFK